MADTCKVKLLTGRSGRGPSGGIISQDAGQEIEVDVAEAHRLSETGQAEFVGKGPARPKKIWPAGSPEAVACGEETPRKDTEE